MAMVEGHDLFSKAVPAVYAIWKRRKTKPRLDIDATTPCTEIDDRINESFFNKGFIKDWEYEAQYIVTPEASLDQCISMLLEMAKL